jgi:flagellar L-ring protein precursor FlgH
MLRCAILCLLHASLAAQSLYMDGADPYAAKRRFRPGDLIQLTIDEAMVADRQDNQAVSRQAGLNAALSMGSTSAGTNITGSLGTSGTNSGSTHKSNQFTTTVTVRVEKLREDGGLEVSGMRLVDLDGEEEKLSVSGVLRPEDVALDSSASSTRLANEEVHLEGKGTAARGGKLGWIHWLLSWVGL